MRPFACLAAALALTLASSRAAEASLVTRMVVDGSLNAANTESYNLDLNLDGVNDFKFTAAFVADPTFPLGFNTVDVPFGSPNAVVVDQSTFDGFPTVSFLSPGSTVGPADQFSFLGDQGNLYYNISSFFGDPPTGNFEGRSGFVGLRFDSPDGLLYGFAQITINAYDDPTAPLNMTIGLVGYNDVPGQPARVVPEPSALALTLLGGLGLIGQARRRRPA